MSRKRQAAGSEPFLLRALAMGFPPGHVVDDHAHEWDQLVHAVEGAMEVRAAGRLWVVPPGRALRVPGGAAHSITCVGRVALRSIYLPPGAAGALSESIAVVPVSPLLRELVLHAIDRAPLEAGVPRHERLAGLILDLLGDAGSLPLDLPWPEDDRAAAVARRLWAEPADPATIDELAEDAGTSARTLERRFVRETGLPLGRWRRQARLLAAVAALAEGRSVTDVAFDVGYESPSAFIAMFRRELGVTPGSIEQGE